MSNGRGRQELLQQFRGQNPNVAYAREGNKAWRAFDFTVVKPYEP